MTDGETGQVSQARTVGVDASSTSGLFGREHELGVLTGLVGQPLDGAGGALVVRGEAGIGKSALLAAVTAGARDRGIRVLSSVGVQSEAQLPFAGLHMLLRPVLQRVKDLPARQRAALLAAFGMADEAAPELFLIGLATLELIADTAASSPLLLIIDDAHWLDQPSCAVLAFVARRLAAERAVMLIAVRDGLPSPFDHAGLTELRVDGLSDDAAGMLLDSRAPGLDPILRDRVLGEATGNPLALVELPAAVQAGQLGGDVLLPSRLPLTARLEQAFAAQESELCSATRCVLLVAATDESGQAGEVVSAARILHGSEITVAAFEPATAARLVEVHGTSVRFRHPLIRSAIYQAATLSQRQAAHAALADVLAGQPDRQVWHRAAAALGPDEQVAAELNAAAARAERRGALAVAITALTRAAQFSEDQAIAASRLLRAGEMAFDTGHPELGPQLLRTAESLDLPADGRAWLSWLREAYSGTGWTGAEKVGSLVQMAERMTASGHPELAIEPIETISRRCWWGNPSQQIRDAVIAAAESLPLREGDPALLFILANADPVKHGATVIDWISRMTPDAADPVGMLDVGAAATAVWAHDRGLEFLNAAVKGLRAQGRLGMLARALTFQAWAAAHVALEALAISAAEEASRLARETGLRVFAASAQLAQAMIAAERGDFGAMEALTSGAEAELVAMGANPMLSVVQLVRGRGAVAHQRYDEGLAHLRRTLDPADIAYLPYEGALGLADLVEAAAHTGDRDSARSYLRELEELVAATSAPVLRAGAAYARPLIADDSHAEALYQAALERELVSWPCFRGRMLLWYGRWLRRQRRVAESRAPLRAARDGFDALGFARLAESARQELRATGETSRRRVPEAWDQLTPQELQIARMAAAGMSNREIGQQLYISHRTVGYHLHQIFPKLGITSRSQLHAALLATPEATT